VFDGASRAHGRLLTMLAVSNTTGGARLGIVASRKLGDAVRRNRAKRLIREMFRRSTTVATSGVDLVVIPRRELFDASYSSLETDFHGTLKRCTARLGSHARRQ
jgi:ribonuclease P protein component